jgi:hypothetical protein
VADLGLAPPTTYAAKYTSTISAVGSTITNGIVTLEMRQIGGSINSGETITYLGSCSAGGMKWAVTGSVATKFVPKN